MREKDTRSFIHFMPQTMPFDLKDRITAALLDSQSELWFPQLTHDLTQAGLQKLYEDTKITEANYGTARVILKDPSAERIVEDSILNSNETEESKSEIFVELLPKNINDQYQKSGLNFYTREEICLNTEITHCFRNALEIIRLVPSLHTSVSYLVKSIHLIKPEADEYDVSFSKPDLPFSIFVSVPKKNTLINALRVAEAIVHEAMHLQLTLIEDAQSLVIPEVELYFSPWMREYRSSYGILHGLYVFSVINQFFQRISKLIKSKKALTHIKLRLVKTAEETEIVKSFKDSPNLTDAGFRIVSKLLIIDPLFKDSE